MSSPTDPPEGSGKVIHRKVVRHVANQPSGWKMFWRLTRVPLSFLAGVIVTLLAVIAANILNPSTGGSGGGGKAFVVDAEHGRQLFVSNCASCHGNDGQGMPNQGLDLRNSKFIATENDGAVIKFLRLGRAANDPKSQMKIQMPPRGGNPTLEEEHLAAIVMYMREMQKAYAAANPGAATQPVAASAPATQPMTTSAQ